MEASFWHDRWNANEIGFHQPKPNALLERNFAVLALPKGSRIFLPLCGKTLDIGWLLANGYRVAGAELSENAVKQLFEELGVTPDITPTGKLTRYSVPDIDIFVGDIFELSADLLGTVDAVYDRAALIALPDEMRRRYAGHLREITGTVSQLLITIEYDQRKMPGPPFSVDGETLKSLYNGSYRITSLEEKEIRGGFKGQIPASEVVWHLDKA